MKLKQLFCKNIVLNLLFSWVLLFIAAIALTSVMLLLQVNGTQALKLALFSNPLILVLNLLPVLLFMVLLFFATGNLVISVGVVGFIAIVMSIVNRFKMIFRNDPFMPWDIMLGGEVMGISKSFSPKLIIGTALGILLIIAVIVFAFIFIKNKNMNVLVRVGGSVLTVVVMIVCNSLLYSNAGINANMQVIGNIYNQMDQYNSKGFLYQFIYTYNTGKITMPKDYDESKIADLSGNMNISDSVRAQKKPHVILILGEAFSEIPSSHVLNYEGFDDPLENYKAIKAESDSGFLVVPNVGGGTADTEFDILTGINTRNFRGMPYSNMLITKNMNGLPNILKQLGYKTAALHPGYDWFYNRQNVFPFLGFETFTSISSFNEADNKGMYINEKVTYDRIIDDFNDHLKQNSSSDPLFELVITIQNHGPYEGKYGSLAEKNFNSSEPLDERDENALSNYLLGVSDMDEQLGRLVDEMKNSDEPVVIAYFGDHLPALSYNLYDILLPNPNDTPIIERLRLYRTPYFIWSNDAAKLLLNDNATIPNDMSSFYFGVTLLDYLGFGDVEPFFSYLNTLKNEIPIILENEYVTGDAIVNKNDKENERENLYEQWSYYRVFSSYDE